MNTVPHAARRQAIRDAVGAFALSRALVWAAAGAAVLVLPIAAGREAEGAPLTRWDAVSYLDIAANGYEHVPERRAAHFPLFPLLVHLLPGTEAAAYVLSAAAFVAALWLLHRLAALELGREAARATVLLLAFSPWAFYFAAPYTEALFLLLSVGAFYAARTERWAAAALCVALASGTRNTGILLVVPVALLYWWPRRRIGREAAWLALAPAGLVAYCVYLERIRGDALAWASAGEEFDRTLTFPLVALWKAFVAAVEAPVHLVFGGGQRDGVFYDTLPFLLLLLAGVAAVWLWRKLHPAYGAYVALALVPPLANPEKAIPLHSLPRYLTVLFPLFMALAVLAGRRGAVRPLVAGFGALGAVLTATFATWHFVA